MRKIFYLFAIVLLGFVQNVNANTGDTTWVQATHVNLDYYNNFDSTVVFPDSTKDYRKIYVILTVGQYTCPPGTQYCHQWDYDIENYVMTPSGDTFELARIITPYATSGTPGFGSAWKQHYIFDVTDYRNILRNSATIRSHYSGYSGGFTYDVRFAFIEGIPERNVLSVNKLWDHSVEYGVANSIIIDSIITAHTLTPPAGTQAANMKFIITGHGYDSTSGCCEFDRTGVGHTYNVVVNSNPVAQLNMNQNCGLSELYPQGGTWLYGRAGNWCPGERVSTATYALPGVSAGTPYSVDVDFDDTYYGGFSNAQPYSHGSYKIAGAVFYYGPYNHTVDASVEDIIAPTNFEWYKRENPRASMPMVKFRNTGSTTITTMLIEYGVKDSAMQRYIWTGSLASSRDTVITLPQVQALTNLSMSSASGAHSFIARIVSVNGQADGYATNDTLTSHFNVAPTWPGSFIVSMHTNNEGEQGLNQNPSETSWKITDANGAIVAQRSGATINKTYNDTVILTSDGFYTLEVTDLGCNGLSWWANQNVTAGSLVIKDYFAGTNIPMNNYSYSGGYHDDFGCDFTQTFTTLTGNCTGTVPTISRNGDSLTASPAATSYQWYYNSARLPGATGSTIAMRHNNGNYSVKTTDGNGCSAVSGNFVILNLGVNDLADFSHVSIAPNPAKDQFMLTVGTDLLGTSYSLSDLTGRTIHTATITGENTKVTVAGLSSGIYLLTIGTQNTHTFKIVKD